MLPTIAQLTRKDGDRVGTWGPTTAEQIADRFDNDGITFTGVAAAVATCERWLNESNRSAAAALLGAKGGAAGRGAAKRRNVDYSALGKLGGRPRKSCEICGSRPAYRKGLCVACDRRRREDDRVE